MKKSMMLMTMLLMACVTFAKDIKTVVLTTTPQMHCESCENKIKGNLRFEKGIKEVETNVEEQSVTVQYDADKTNEDNIMKAFGKFGYQATKKEAGQKTCDMKDCKGCPQEASEKQCCKEKACGKCEKEQACPDKACGKEASEKQCCKEKTCGKCEKE